jgi:hypothetical protein
VTTFQVYDVRRQCSCGTEWMGKAFTAPGDGEVRPGKCAECLEKDEQRTRSLTHPVLEASIRDVELGRPHSVGDVE